MNSKYDYDLIIAGSGFGGCILSIVCQKIGLKTLIIEKKDHPRFAIGESTTPEYNIGLHKLAEKYSIPFLKSISSYTEIIKNRLPISCWPKSCFYYLYQEQAHNLNLIPSNEMFFQTAPWPTGPDAHLYREEFDLFLKNKAVEYGATYLPHITIENFDFDQNQGSKISIHKKNGVKENYNCRLFVDGTGKSSWIANYLKIRIDGPKEAPIHSYTVFNHFENYNHFESTFSNSLEKRTLNRNYATAHHYNENGWFWVIPFDNDITSVGWVGNGEITSKEANYKEIFLNALEKCPFLNKCMEEAKPLMDFKGAPKIQFSTEQMVGDGWFLLPHSFEFNDPFYSSGMPMTISAITRLVDVLTKTNKDKPLLKNDMIQIEEKSRKESLYIRKIVALSQHSFKDPLLFDSTFFLHRLSVLCGGINLSYPENHYCNQLLWGMSDPLLRDFIDKVYSYFNENIKNKTITPKAIHNYRQFILDNDPINFHLTKMGTYRGDQEYLSSINRILDFLRKNGSVSFSKSFSRTAKRWVSNLYSQQGRKSKVKGLKRKYPPGLLKDQIKSLVKIK